jgi:hypothetical protein
MDEYIPGSLHDGVMDSGLKWYGHMQFSFDAPVTFTGLRLIPWASDDTYYDSMSGSKIYYQDLIDGSWVHHSTIESTEWHGHARLGPSVQRFLPARSNEWRVGYTSRWQGVGELEWTCGLVEFEVYGNGKMGCDAPDCDVVVNLGLQRPAGDSSVDPALASQGYAVPQHEPGAFRLMGTLEGSTVEVFAPNITIGGSIDVTGRGHQPTRSIAALTHDCSMDEYMSGRGGAHGGDGGVPGHRSQECMPWPDTPRAQGGGTQPWLYGQAGEAGQFAGSFHALGGAGGGRVRIVARDTLYAMDTGDVVKAKGGDSESNGQAPGGGGAGGSVIVRARRFLGNGDITTQGGAVASTSYQPGCGSGGRIAVFVDDELDDRIELEVASAASTYCTVAASGTAYVELGGVKSLRLDNSNGVRHTDHGNAATPVPSDLWSSLHILHVEGRAVLRADAPPGTDLDLAPNRLVVASNAAVEADDLRLKLFSLWSQGTIQGNTSLRIIEKADKDYAAGISTASSAWDRSSGIPATGDWSTAAAAGACESSAGVRRVDLRGNSLSCVGDHVKCQLEIDMPRTALVHTSSATVGAASIDVRVRWADLNGKWDASSRGYAAGMGPGSGNFTVEEGCTACKVGGTGASHGGLGVISSKATPSS